MLRFRNTGNFKASDLVNMDQTPLPLVLDDGKTYDEKEEDVWVQSGQSSLDKSQATVQLTVFADGVDRVKPTVVFRGKGFWISAKKTKLWQVKVMDQEEKAWCDQEITKEWVSAEWTNPFKNPVGQNSDGKILIADVHHVQQTDSLKELLKKQKTP